MDCPKKNWLNSWHVKPSGDSDYDLIDGLRGVAILMVVAHHLVYINPAYGLAVRIVGGFIRAGFWGVPIFFSLSGFLISMPFWKRKMKGSAQVVPAGYGWRRFYKIYPPLAFSILVLTPVYFFRSGDYEFFPIAARWLAGLPLVSQVSCKLNPVMWSLVVEVQFYVALPVIFLCLKKMTPKSTLCIVPAILLVCGKGSDFLYAVNGIKNTLEPTINLHFPSGLDAFTFGVLLAGLESHWGGLPKSWAKLGNVGLVLLVLSLAATSLLKLDPKYEPYAQGFVLDTAVKMASVFLICYVANPSVFLFARMLGNPWLRWCGIISYEWYLFHGPVAVWIRKSLGFTNGSIVGYGLTVGGSFVVGLGIAAVVYRYFSLPILKGGRAKHTHGTTNEKTLQADVTATL